MLSSSKTKLKKVLILFLVIAITYSNFLIVGANFYKGSVSYAVDETATPEVTTSEEELKNEPVFEIGVDLEDMHKTKMGKENEFVSAINLDLKNVKNIQLEDVENKFYDFENEEGELASLRYVKTILNKEQLENVLGKDGTFTVFDEKNNCIATLSLDYINKLEQDNQEPQKYKVEVEFRKEDGTIGKKEDWAVGSYITVKEDVVEIEYNIDIKEAKIVINTEVNNIEENFVIENTKSVFDVQDLDNLNYLTQNIKYTYEEIKDEDIEANIENTIEEDKVVEEDLIVENTVKFKNTVTRALLNVDNLEWVANTTNNVNIDITLDTQEEDAEMFKNPIIIIELPECVESVNSENSICSVENDGGAFEDKNVTIISLLGRKYVIMRLVGEQTKESIVNGNTEVLLSLEAELNDLVDEALNELNVYYKNDTVTAYNSGAAFDTISQKITLLKVVNEEEIIEEDNVSDEAEVQDEIAYDDEYMEEMEAEEIGDFNLVVKTNKDLVKVGEEFNYRIYINNSSFESIDVTLEDAIPDGLEYVGTQVFNFNPDTLGFTDEVNAENIVKYNNDSKTFRVDFNNFAAATMNEKDNSLVNAKTKLVVLKVKPTSLPADEYSRVINNEVKATKNGEEEIIKNAEVTVSAPIFKVEINEIENELNLGDVAKFEVTVKNLGLIAEDNTEVEFVLPEEFEGGYIEADNYSYSVAGKTAYANIFVPAEGTCTIRLFATYKENVAKDKGVNIYANVNQNITNVWSTMLLKNNEPQEDVQTVAKNNEEVAFESVKTDETKEVQDETENVQENNEQVFSLGLTQYLNKVVVADDNNRTEYNYSDAKDVKINIEPDKTGDNTVVTMEYKIVVENNGTVPGYATEIVDYVPEGFEFNKEDNPDWDITDNGNIYSDILKEKLLNPGEKAVVAVKLSKKVTDNNFGKVKNVAQITKTSNDLGLENEILLISNQEKNDSDTVNVTMSKKHSSTLYIVLVIIAIVIIAVVVCLIIKHKKETANKEGC